MAIDLANEAAAIRRAHGIKDEDDRRREARTISDQRETEAERIRVDKENRARDANLAEIRSHQRERDAAAKASAPTPAEPNREVIAPPRGILSVEEFLIAADQFRVVGGSPRAIGDGSLEIDQGDVLEFTLPANVLRSGDRLLTLTPEMLVAFGIAVIEVLTVRDGCALTVLDRRDRPARLESSQDDMTGTLHLNRTIAADERVRVRVASALSGGGQRFYGVVVRRARPED